MAQIEYRIKKEEALFQIGCIAGISKWRQYLLGVGGMLENGTQNEEDVVQVDKSKLPFYRRQYHVYRSLKGDEGVFHHISYVQMDTSHKVF